MITTEDVVIRLLLGTLLGSIVGFEREVHGRPAGFRTHLLVCLASVLIMIVSEEYYHLALMDPAFIRVDPARIAAGAITGVGFLGAGVIIKSGFNVQGLTTAACLWIVSAIGLSVGAGLYTPAVISTVISVLSLWSLRLLERNMSKLKFRGLHIITEATDQEEAISEILKDMGMRTVAVDYEFDTISNDTHYNMTISSRKPLDAGELLNRLKALGGIKKVSLKKG